MKCSLGISNVLEEISSLSHSDTGAAGSGHTALEQRAMQCWSDNMIQLGLKSKFFCSEVYALFTAPFIS